MPFKDLYYFAAQCLALNKHPEFRETIIPHFSTGKVNLDDFVFLCSNHLVLPAIYLNFKKHNLLHVFPAEYKDHIEAIYLQNKKRNLEILQQVDEINLTLQSENIVPVYLKGTANLLDNVYSDVGERMIGDIDLLVNDIDYLKAAELVMKLGYQYEGKIYHDVSTAKHYPRLYRTDVPADIEIHRIPVDIEHSRLFTSKLIFRDKKPIAGKANCFVPSDAHKAIHSFIHAQLSNLGYWFKQTTLRDLYDMYLLSKITDANSVINHTEEKRKIIAYLFFTNRAFGNSNIQEIKENGTSRQYIVLHNWFLDHPGIHHWYIFTVKVVELLFVRLFRGMGNIFKAKSWSGFFKRVTDRTWHKMGFYRIKNFYKNYISKLL